jgi:hypothetical protein
MKGGLTVDCSINNNPTPERQSAKLGRLPNTTLNRGNY